MSSVNKVILVGNLGRDPEIRYMTNGDAIANISLATTYKGKDKDHTEWHRVVFFGRVAEIVGLYLKKGAQVYVEGRLQTRKYDDKDGVTRYTTEIVGDSMQMLGSRADSPAAPTPPAPSKPAPLPKPVLASIDDDDIPF